ncbi:MAG: hypothetical protein ACTSWN_04450 [Promethearchaeota archaeon]
MLNEKDSIVAWDWRDSNWFDQFEPKQKSKLGKLCRFKLNFDQTYETIFSTYDETGQPYISPIGIKIKKPDSKMNKKFNIKIEANIFENTKILNFILKNKACCIHFLNYESLYYLIYAFKDKLYDVIKSREKKGLFAKSTKVSAPIIKDLENYAEVRVLDCTFEKVEDNLIKYEGSSKKKARVVFKPISIIINNPFVSPVSRLHGLFIEFMVDFSRFNNIDVKNWELEKYKKDLTTTILKIEKVSPPGSLLNRICNELFST